MNPTEPPTGLADPERRADWRRELGGVFRDRLVVVGLLPLAAAPPWLELLREAGARRPLVLALGRGAGPVPGEDEAEVVLLPAGAHASMTEELRAQDALAHDLPAEALAALEAYDPGCEAVWMLGPFVTSDQPLYGRRVVGGRPASWLALEDKLLAEGIWDAVQVPRSPARVVPVERDALAAVSLELDEGAGVVWTGDARDGFHGGGDFTRWVADTEDHEEALVFFAERCDRVRVMPFLDGVPCSIHGFVLPDGTAAFRPVELAILRGARRRLVYGGQGTTWDPLPADREAMRELVRAVGEHLRGRVGYRGAFGIDGVMTAAGFRPTEINTRFAGGLAALTSELDPHAFTLLSLVSLAGHDPGVGVRDLEDWAVPAMDHRRVVKALAVSPRPLTEGSVELPVRWDGAELRPVDPAGAEAAPATLLVGPSAVGSFVRLTGDLLEAGERLAPLNAALMRFLDERLGAGFGPLEVPPDLRNPDRRGLRGRH